MTSLADIRSTFLDFYRRQGHAVVPSSPLVPRNDLICLPLLSNATARPRWPSNRPPSA